MSHSPLPMSDPRTLAREIPGILDALFPHLVPGVVAYLNQQSSAPTGCKRILQESIRASALARAMLFELAVALAEQLWSSDLAPDWHAALSLAVKRQRRHFDAQVPTSLQDIDRAIALQVARNLVIMLKEVQTDAAQQQLVYSPPIPGYQWIASGVGDFAVGTCLIEVKCTGRNFSSADYRQVLMYWLLSYAGAVERSAREWSHVVLMNPRRGFTLTLSFDELVRLLGAGRSKVELLELFATIVDERRVHMNT
jgi:hypothetical protein